MPGVACSQRKFVIEFDVEAFWTARNTPDVDMGGGESDAEAEDDEERSPAELLALAKSTGSLNAVLGACADFRNAKSTLAELVEGRGHILTLSAKYHAECAGRGIEYDFGRAKWFYRTNSSGSMAANAPRGLIMCSRAAFGRDVVTLAHTRKFERRGRDFMRGYRGGASGLGIEGVVKLVKTHRSAFDTAFTFCREAA